MKQAKKISFTGLDFFSNFTKKTMVISVSGSSGFIGKALSKAIREKGWTMKPISRENLSLPESELSALKIDGSDAVVNLAGAPVSKRWNDLYKQEILESRINSTKKIVSAMGSCTSKPAVFVSVSGTDVYLAGTEHDEQSTQFSGEFLGLVCQEWEKEAMLASSFTRVVIPRLGLVLGSEGGALEKMYNLFNLGLGAKIGNGQQIISFIHIKDLIRAIMLVIEDQFFKGPVNMVSPYPVSNSEFSETLGKVLKQPVFLRIPARIMNLLYGEGASMLLEGRKVIPGKLMAGGFRFNYPTINNSLVNLLG